MGDETWALALSHELTRAVRYSKARLIFSGLSMRPQTRSVEPRQQAVQHLGWIGTLAIWIAAILLLTRFSAIRTWLLSHPPLPTALSSDEIYAQAKPYTVEVWITVGGDRAPASGIVVRSDGLVLTNHHVIAADPTMPVRLADGREFTGTVIQRDLPHDLALIQLDHAVHLPTAPLATDDTVVTVGDPVYAIGSAYGAHWRMTSAHILDLDSRCGSRLSTLRCIRTPSGFLHPGDSGGPLLNRTGQVIGVNRAIQVATGEGVSIPIATVVQFLQAAEGTTGKTTD